MEAVYGHRRGREWTRLGRGIYLRGERPGLIDSLQAWSLVLPARAAYTHLTATRLRGWWQPGPIEAPIFVAARRGVGYPQRPGLVVARLTDWPSASVIGGVRVVTPAESLLACARDLGLLDLIQLADCAVRRKDCTIEELESAARSPRPGVAMLRQLIPLIDPRSESPWESVMRVLHQAAEIPVEPQKEFFDDRGQFVGRGDLWVVATNRINEYDGADHREGDTHRRDLRRERGLVRIGVDRCGYTAVELLHGGGDIIADADRLLRRRWAPERLRRWNSLIHDSLLGPGGQSRVASRWHQRNAG